MKKGILFIFVLLCVANTIYAIGFSSGNIHRYTLFALTDNNVLTAKLKSAITDSRNYEAVERTVEFLQQLRKEQKYQRSGNVDDSDIARMEKESGVQYVCVAELMPVQGGDFVTVRLIDVERALSKCSGELYECSVELYGCSAERITDEVINYELFELSLERIKDFRFEL
jgi:hypothetical protein